jgi:hypothetical protein
MWADPNLNNFYGRVRRIEKAHRKGYGFEAVGTLGRSHNYRREGSLGRLLKTLVLVSAVAVTLKGAIHFYVGAETYDERVAVLAAGEGFDPVGATLMQADPLTRVISAFLAEVFPG